VRDEGHEGRIVLRGPDHPQSFYLTWARRRPADDILTDTEGFDGDRRLLVGCAVDEHQINITMEENL